MIENLEVRSKRKMRKEENRKMSGWEAESRGQKRKMKNEQRNSGFKNFKL
jgi:hypothetical protein